MLKQTHQKLKCIFVEVKYHEGIEMYSFFGLQTQGVTFFFKQCVKLKAFIGPCFYNCK